MRKFLVLLFAFLTLGSSFAEDGHQTLSDVLSRHLVDGKVDYDGIRKESRGELQAFVDSLADADLSRLDETGQIAFWLDAYNGLVIYQVVEKGASPETGRKRAKFFRGRRFEVAGKSLTLDDIEHRALRPLASDPRVHFVLVCGASSCPPLRASSFLGSSNLEAELESATREYINDERNVKIDLDSRRLTLNKIFYWYKDDFGDVLEFVSRYRSESERQALLEGTWSIEFEDYDWTLNEAAK